MTTDRNENLGVDGEAVGALTLRVVLKQPNERKKIGATSVKKSWDLTAERRGNAEQQMPYELAFRAHKGDLTVTYVEDVIAECTYVVLQGADRETGVDIIKQSFEFWTDEELIAAWGSAASRDDKMVAILRIGVGAPIAPRADFESTLVKALSDADCNVREAAIVALCYRDWTIFNAKLKDIADNDADELCRERARVALEALAQTA